jgi:hypothetical protein
MNYVYKLFKYAYTYYVQGTEEHDVEYALLYVPEDATFNNNRSLLYSQRNKPYYHEIDIESVEDLTVRMSDSAT